MAGAMIAPDPLRDYNGGVETINAMRDMINKEKRANGEKPIEVDHKAIAANEKKFSEITSDIAQMDFKKWLALTIAGFQNQDPMNPKDPGAVTAELANIGMAVGFSKIPGEIVELKALMSKGLSLSATNRLGQTVEAQHDTFKLQVDKPAKLAFDLPLSAPKVKLTIYNDKAQPVREMLLENSEMGRTNFEWDGKNDKGEAAEPGHYRFNVRALDQEGEPLNDPATGKPPMIRKYVTGTLESSFTNDKGISTAVVDGSEMPFDALKRFYGKNHGSEQTFAKAPEPPFPLPKPPLTEQEIFIEHEKVKLAQEMHELEQEIKAQKAKPIDPKDLPPGLADL